jgi:NTE family protein
VTTGSQPSSNEPTLALVFSGGGARAAYQAGVLEAIAECAPELDVPILTGVSAGAINATSLAAHPGPFGQAVSDLRREWERLTPSQVYRVEPIRVGGAMWRWAFNMLVRRRKAPPVLRGLMDMQPLKYFLKDCIDFGGIARNIAAGRLRAAALSATCYNTGQTVTFVEGREDVELWQRFMRVAVGTRLEVEHLMASTAIPLIFPAQKIGNAFYGDGSVRQTAPLAPAIHLGANRIVAVAMRAESPAETCATVSMDYPVAAEVFGLLLHSVFLDSLDADAERLERVNEVLRAVPSGHDLPGGLRPVDLLLLRPSRDLAEMARGCRAELPGAVEFLVRSIGGAQAKGSDFQSYLMFQPEYTGPLMELGYQDAKAQRGEIERFLAAGR